MVQFDCSAESILQDFGKNVFQVNRNIARLV